MAFKRVLSEATILKNARDKLGMTQQQVANEARVQLRQYQRFESNERNLSSSSFYIACRILDALQLDIASYAHGKYILASD